MTISTPQSAATVQLAPSYTLPITIVIAAIPLFASVSPLIALLIAVAVMGTAAVLESHAHRRRGTVSGQGTADESAP